MWVMAEQLTLGYTNVYSTLRLIRHILIALI